MGLKIIDQIWEKSDDISDKSDVDVFMGLLCVGEMILKLTVAGIIAAIVNERDRHKYRLLYKIVRSIGLQEWINSMEDALVGPASQHLRPSAYDEQRELTQKTQKGAWQYEAVSALLECLDVFEIKHDPLQMKTDLRTWYAYFVKLRNKTRAHGVLTSEKCGAAAISLKNSLSNIITNLRLFNREWAYLYQNLSGKYKIIRLSDKIDHFAPLAKASSEKYVNGIYVFFDVPTKVDLVETGAEASEFFFANGGFREKSYEMISYLTGNVNECDSSPYLLPLNNLPGSETEGLGQLEKQGNCFGNIPPLQKGYINRVSLEALLYEVLTDDRHPIVTLVGRGGIGKTSLALSVLSRICSEGKYFAIVWFSARDIDLLSHGPKVVKPHVLGQKEISKYFVELLNPIESFDKSFNVQHFFERNMTKSDIGDILYVFDNFETVKNPLELYTWIDSFIRLPNKVLITTRFREFKGDYDIEVGGMTEKECEELIAGTASTLEISNLLTEEYKDAIYNESEGHPYVIKMLLGDVCKAGKLINIKRIVASREDILKALFERTYAALSTVAQRVFLTLSGWSSTIPQVALEAVMLRQANERIRVSSALDELVRSSMIELVESEADKQIFINVPLVATIFGNQKLAVSPWKISIQEDVELLQMLGAAQRADIRHGLKPRVHRLIGNVAKMVESGKTIDDFLFILEFISRKYHDAYLLIANMFEEQGSSSGLKRAAEYIQHFLEEENGKPEASFAWKRLSEIYQKLGDYLGEVHALSEMCQYENVPYYLISNVASRFNELFKKHILNLDSSEKVKLIQSVVSVMENRQSEASATDCSRIAWLFLNLKDEKKASEYAEIGLRLDGDNEHCVKIARRLRIL